MAEAPDTDFSSGTIGFVGLGNMGSPMAIRLAAAGYHVLGYDVSPQVTEQLADVDGIAICDRVSDVAAAAKAVILMLPNSDIVEQVLLHQGLLAAMVDGAMVIDMSSSEPARTRALATRAAQDGVILLDAPVSGGVTGAQRGTLTVMVGGPADRVEAVTPLLQAIGSRVVRCGEVGAGDAVKALNNLMSATHLLVTSEAILAGQDFGLDPAVVLDVVNGSSGRSGSTENKWPNFVLTEAFNSGFGLRLMLKDMRIALGLAEASHRPARLSAASVQLWAEAAEQLPPDADHTEIVRWLQSIPDTGPDIGSPSSQEGQA
jgi:3-hydroxyisobutyrate dehydrogenase